VENDLNKDEALVRDFLIESEELLQGMDQDMIALESAPRDSDLLNRIFRALHTIKGTSGFLGFDPIVRVGHRAEDLLNALRRGDVEVFPQIMDTLLAVRDQIGAMLRDIHEGGLKSYDLNGLLDELESLRKQADVPLRLGEMLVKEKVIEPGTLQRALDEQAKSPQSRNLGEILLKVGTVTAADIGHAVARQKQIAELAQADARSVRVDVRKLDELISLIGELVLERNQLNQLCREFGGAGVSGEGLNSALARTSARLSFITEELQLAGLKTRTVPINAVFSKFPRLVRDVARSLQKEVQLILTGKETELDKAMVELIADPLVHLIRNSLDHGIESPKVRESLGKPRHGTIHLGACQEGDQIVINISDDGAGIDPRRVGLKAVEKGLVTPERLRSMSTREILDFIFLPGFSTVEKASDLSGRGVGMDVVRSNLKKINGIIALESTPGRGTTVLLKLPLTLAILPVLFVRVSEEIYGLPLRSVLETVRVEPGQLHVIEGREVLRVRGQTLPLLRLTETFALKPDRDSGRRAVIVGVAEQRVALLVDGLVGQESTVIKSLSSYLHHCSSLAGATVSGDGRVRLVLDPAGLISAAASPTALQSSGILQ
jgi:two-component system, chemotaxis family, sensor kinase CheA